MEASCRCMIQVYKKRREEPDLSELYQSVLGLSIVTDGDPWSLETQRHSWGIQALQNSFS
ncbi:hypothetical protein RRG08_062705 [Elysia crispata]|uniref:Uncharacterized protein n=1 Tax=Elysia crispata TaxID=231223 RepID=A0AAE1ACE6_9GAST|nr:hypothetical protein RRG08_062705 [Elysia crispata]